MNFLKIVFLFILSFFSITGLSKFGEPEDYLKQTQPNLEFLAHSLIEKKRKNPSGAKLTIYKLPKFLRSMLLNNNLSKVSPSDVEKFIDIFSDHVSRKEGIDIAIQLVDKLRTSFVLNQVFKAQLRGQSQIAANAFHKLTPYFSQFESKKIGKYVRWACFSFRSQLRFQECTQFAKIHIRDEKALNATLFLNNVLANKIKLASRYYSSVEKKYLPCGDPSLGVSIFLSTYKYHFAKKNFKRALKCLELFKKNSKISFDYWIYQLEKTEMALLNSVLKDIELKRKFLKSQTSTVKGVFPEITFDLVEVKVFIIKGDAKNARALLSSIKKKLNGLSYKDFDLRVKILEDKLSGKKINLLPGMGFEEARLIDVLKKVP